MVNEASLWRANFYKTEIVACFIISYFISPDIHHKGWLLLVKKHHTRQPYREPKQRREIGLAVVG